MELLRDIIRDLVGILFPGGFLILFFSIFLFGLLIFVIPINLFNNIFSFNNFILFSILIIFSYIAGQSLRMKQLNDLETICTNAFRLSQIDKLNNNSSSQENNKDNTDENSVQSKNCDIEFWDNEFNKSINFLIEKDKDFNSGKIKPEEYKDVYREHQKKYGLWEEFPYPIQLKERRLLRQSANYNNFFKNYDAQGITKDKTFFNFCKSVIIENSPSFKEEVHQQESLVRLFAGIYYAIRYSRIFITTTAIIHIIFIILSKQIIDKFDVIKLKNINISLILLIITPIILFTFWHFNKEIISRLRLMRVKEVNLAYDGFYIISKKNNLEL